MFESLEDPRLSEGMAEGGGPGRPMSISRAAFRRSITGCLSSSARLARSPQYTLASGDWPITISLHAAPESEITYASPSCPTRPSNHHSSRRFLLIAFTMACFSLHFSRRSSCFSSRALSITLRVDPFKGATSPTKFCVHLKRFASFPRVYFFGVQCAQLADFLYDESGRRSEAGGGAERLRGGSGSPA